MISLRVREKQRKYSDINYMQWLSDPRDARRALNKAWGDLRREADKNTKNKQKIEMCLEKVKSLQNHWLKITCSDKQPNYSRYEQLILPEPVKEFVPKIIIRKKETKDLD